MRKFAISLVFSLVGVGFTVVTALATDVPCCIQP